MKRIFYVQYKEYDILAPKESMNEFENIFGKNMNLLEALFFVCFLLNHATSPSSTTLKIILERHTKRPTYCEHKCLQSIQQIPVFSLITAHREESLIHQAMSARTQSSILLQII